MENLSHIGVVGVLGGFDLVAVPGFYEYVLILLVAGLVVVVTA